MNAKLTEKIIESFQKESRDGFGKIADCLNYSILVSLIFNQFNEVFNLSIVQYDFETKHSLGNFRIVRKVVLRTFQVIVIS